MKTLATRRALRSAMLGILIFFLFSCGHTTSVQRMRTLIDSDNLAELQNEISLGGDVNNALMYAVNTSHLQAVKLLLDKGANPNNMEVIYVVKGSVERVGADYFYRVEQGPGKTALWYAISNKHKEMVSILLEKGAAVNRDFIDSSAKGSESDFLGPAFDPVVLSTGVYRQAFKVEELQKLGYNPEDFPGVVRAERGGPVIVYEGLKWTDHYIKRQRIEPNALSRFSSVSQALSGLQLDNTTFRFPGSGLVPPRQFWKKDEVWISTDIMHAYYVLAPKLPGQDKPVRFERWGAFGMFCTSAEDACIKGWSTVNSLAATNWIEFKDEKSKEGYVLSNVPPRQAGRRQTLMQFAESIGDVEVIRLLAQAQEKQTH